jgi:uncharacterized repeat protein (TIGR03803 family)
MNKVRICGFPTVAALVLVAAMTVQAQTYTDLYNFGLNPGDPVQPQPANIVQGRDGNLYSTTERGGTNGVGTVFKVTPTGDLSVLYSFGFQSGQGQFPTGGLTLGTDGDLYGSTQAGGSLGMGTVYKITPTGTLTVLHNFAGSDGSAPYAPPVQGVDGNFYGTTISGGVNNKGTVYKMTPAGQLITLHSFNSTDGSGPLAALVQGTDGEFFGTTIGGGTNLMGTVFKITSTGQLTILHEFDSTDGANPDTPLVIGQDGDLYGTTTMGGAEMGGAIFKITNVGQFTPVYSFLPGPDGTDPECGMVLATDGNFYGTAFMGGNNNGGTIYGITPNGTYSVAYTFNGTEGCCPFVTPTQHTSGLLYGDTYAGGTHNLGVFYSLNENLRAFVSFLPPAGRVGKKVGILGQGFTGASAVSFDGISAKFRVLEDTFLGAIVPAGAKTGYVTVATPSGTLKSNRKFFVIP